MTTDTYHTSAIAGPSSRFHNTNNKAINSARSSISLMSIPTDEEKWIPSPVPKLATARTFFGGSLRKRRLLVSGSVILAVMGLGGWSWYIDGGLPEMVGFWGDTDVSTPHSYSDLSDTPSKPYEPNHVPILPYVDIYQWGLSSDSEELLDGLIPWPTRARFSEIDEPLSSLGKVADEAYNMGYWELPETAAQLDVFISTSFPEAMQGILKYGIARYLAGVGSRDSWDKEKFIWQTDKNREKEGSSQVGSWKKGTAKEEGWEWEMIEEGQADAWVEKHFAGSRIHQMWNLLPAGILRSDTLRYLLLLVKGGIYSDTDTRLRKPPSKWGQGATLWANGKGLSKQEKARIAAGEDWKEVLGPPSIVVGVEADVGERGDWHDWWSRPVQIVQWTIASAPSHPIILSAILRILHSTAKAIDWTHNHADHLQQYEDQGKKGSNAYKELQGVNVLDEPSMGGAVGVMDWTGPGLFTDAVMSYLNVRYGLVWTDLKGLTVPLRVGDVVILPVTGFSPGVGNFGSKAPSHPQAMVEHGFAGSWKEE